MLKPSINSNLNQLFSKSHERRADQRGRKIFLKVSPQYWFFFSRERQTHSGQNISPISLQLKWRDSQYRKRCFNKRIYTFLFSQIFVRIDFPQLNQSWMNCAPLPQRHAVKWYGCIDLVIIQQQIFLPFKFTKKRWKWINKTGKSRNLMKCEIRNVTRQRTAFKLKLICVWWIT